MSGGADQILVPKKKFIKDGKYTGPAINSTGVKTDDKGKSETHRKISSSEFMPHSGRRSSSDSFYGQMRARASSRKGKAGKLIDGVDFAPRIKTLVKSAAPDMRISPAMVKYLATCAKTYLWTVGEQAAKLTKQSGKETVSDRAIDAAHQMIAGSLEKKVTLAGGGSANKLHAGGKKPDGKWTGTFPKTQLKTALGASRCGTKALLFADNLVAKFLKDYIADAAIKARGAKRGTMTEVDFGRALHDAKHPGPNDKNPYLYRGPVLLTALHPPKATVDMHPTIGVTKKAKAAAKKAAAAAAAAKSASGRPSIAVPRASNRLQNKSATPIATATPRYV